MCFYPSISKARQSRSSHVDWMECWGRRELAVSTLFYAEQSRSSPQIKNGSHNGRNCYVFFGEKAASKPYGWGEGNEREKYNFAEGNGSLFRHSHIISRLDERQLMWFGALSLSSHAEQLARNGSDKPIFSALSGDENMAKQNSSGWKKNDKSGLKQQQRERREERKKKLKRRRKVWKTKKYSEVDRCESLCSIDYRSMMGFIVCVCYFFMTIVDISTSAKDGKFPSTIFFFQHHEQWAESE